MAKTSENRTRTGGNRPQERSVDLPAPDARMAHLLAAAKDTFTSKGFAATTMDDIAGAAGMSKKTLYKLFESKTELFRAMLLRSLPEAHFANPPLAGPPTTQLRTALRRIADVALAPGEIALHRLIIGERQASPDLGRMFGEVIMETGLDDLVELLKTVRLEPRLEGLPLRLVAEMLLGMVFSHDHFRLLTDDGFRLNRRALDKRIDLAIAMFCATEDHAR
ncbi:TetR/AcrR family transcriptional regulator [Bradyrhizobium liaoningense]|uniref:TetR/AcrR family transcriptional regulator n=1 Tax=Bradyrhizobium liaoningense TaxID=43992 RepID=UPI001BADD9FF|nr:TetR/AcrR family transcriptional regulator [Bradyrhizobium liaoningense]MBR0818184.1 TetR/AcrR family transcriptional regulator [Bradyrhizobium liaoningense]